MKNTLPVPGKLKRKYLVNWPFQVGFVVALCAPVLLTGLFSIYVVYNSAHAALVETMFRSHLATGEIGKMLAIPILKANLLVFTISCLLAIGAILLIAYRSNLSIKTIESDLLNFGEKPAISKWKQSTALWSGIESDAVGQFQVRLRGFCEAADLLASLEFKISLALMGTQDQSRQDMVNILKAAESECRQSLDQFQWNIA